MLPHKPKPIFCHCQSFRMGLLLGATVSSAFVVPLKSMSFSRFMAPMFVTYLPIFEQTYLRQYFSPLLHFRFYISLRFSSWRRDVNAARIWNTLIVEGLAIHSFFRLATLLAPCSLLRHILHFIWRRPCAHVSAEHKSTHLIDSKVTDHISR